MNAQAIDLPPAIGSPIAGGFYAGRILINDLLFGLIVAPKQEGGHKATAWSKSFDSVPGALSWNDGAANTGAIAEAGSKLALWALNLEINGFKDWYLPSLDELELCYRNLKPTTGPNSLWARSGINLSAVPPTYPYAEASPAQTDIEIFRAGGPEAFDEAPYWSSTQHAGFSDYAWGQGFDNGNQDDWFKVNYLRARAVRRLAL